MDYIQSRTKLITAQLLIQHVLIYLLDYFCCVILDALAHLHYTFTFALFLALDLHLVEDLFELGLGHELLISVLIDHLLA